MNCVNFLPFLFNVVMAYWAGAGCRNDVRINNFGSTGFIAIPKNLPVGAVPENTGETVNTFIIRRTWTKLWYTNFLHYVAS